MAHAPIVDATHPTSATPRAQRHDGWTPDRQRAFLEAVADGHSVEAAARSVGLSAASAYAFRRRAAGAAFALGWDGARLLARETVVDALTQRVIDGQEERMARPDGSEIVRFRYDNRLASAMLARLDRYADGLAATDAGRTARLAAQDFDAYLDLVARDAGPARVALFLPAREVDNGGDTQAARAAAPRGPALEPLAALARADRYARTGAGLASEIDTADLDPEQRAHWTAAQWSRAEAAGLVSLGPPPLGTSQLPQLHEAVEDWNAPVWYDEKEREWRTRFPPPDGVYVDESGDYGDPDYERSLTPAETRVMEDEEDRELEERRAVEAAERDAWFLDRVLRGQEEDEEEEPPLQAPADPGVPPDYPPCATAAGATPWPSGDGDLPNPPQACHAAPPGGGTDASARRSCPTQTPGPTPAIEGASPWIRRI